MPTVRKKKYNSVSVRLQVFFKAIDESGFLGVENTMIIERFYTWAVMDRECSDEWLICEDEWSKGKGEWPIREGK